MRVTIVAVEMDPVEGYKYTAKDTGEDMVYEGRWIMQASLQKNNED
jgi:hypothetical protein